MATQTYSTTQGRINEVLGETLAHAIQVEVLAKGVNMKQMPKNKGDNITYRRWLPFGATTGINSQNRPIVVAADFIVQEGTTPAANTLTPVDVNAVLQQYAVLFSYTDKIAELYEDDIPKEMRIQTGESMGLVKEMIRYGVMKAATNVIYSGGTSRLTVDEPISLRVIRKMTRTMKLNHAKKKRRILAPSVNYETFGIEAAFIVFVSTDGEADVRDLPNFRTVVEYGSRQPICENELGTCEEFLFITSPELAPYPDAGANVGATGLVSTSGSKIDVYPYIVMGEDAVCDVALNGEGAFKINHIPHTSIDKSDMLGQRGYVCAKFWSAVVVTNGGWMGVIESGVSSLD